jgi:hypothetical protein
MRNLLIIIVLAVILVVGLKAAGVRLPFIDYAVGPIGAENGPAMPDIEIKAPGFGEFPAP